MLNTSRVTVLRIILLSVAILAACQSSGQATKPNTSEEAMKITLTPVDASWIEAEQRWAVIVDVRFENTGDKLFQLDKVTACSGGSIQNHVFTVTLGEQEIDYQGMMKKRAPPGRNGFHRLKSGQSVSERVDLGSVYDLPAAGGTVAVRFDHYNHFSPDDVQLQSEPVKIGLQR